MKKKLQVFVSSTFTDLIIERQAAVSAILKLGHIPAGMELFTANDKSQWETIKRWIDESDVYMLILGGRYGSIDPESKISYTELEYNYAVETQKPLFAVVINEDALDEKVRLNGINYIEKEYSKELIVFRKKVLSNMSSFFDDIKDIKICVMESLPQIDSDKDLSGWVSGKDVTDTKTLVDEIGSLKNENNDLKSQLKKAQLKSENKSLSVNDEFTELKELFEIKRLKGDGYSSDLANEEYSLYDLFMVIKSSLVIGVSSRETNSNESYGYNVICPELNIYGLVENIPIPGRTSRQFVLTEKGQKFAAFLEKDMLLKPR